jgi:anti-anti-sigma factor
VVGRAVDRAARGADHRPLVMDFSDVRTVSSLGLGMIVHLCQQASEVGARALISGASNDLADMIRVLRIDRLCRVVGADEDPLEILER